MSKYSKKRVFVYRNARKYYLEKHNGFNLMRYCIYDLIRRRTSSYTNSFEGKQKDISDWLNVSKGTISYHITEMAETKILKKDDFGLELIDGFEWEDFILNAKKGAFVILDFNIREKLNQEYKLTLEQFAVLSLIFSIQISTLKSLSKASIRRLLLMNKDTVNRGLEELKKLELIKPYEKTNSFSLTEETRLNYFNTYELDLESSKNKNSFSFESNRDNDNL